MARRVRAAAAALLLLVIVGAVPAALLSWGVAPAALANLTRPDDGSAVLALLTVIGWLAWLAFTVSVLVEAVNLIGRRAVPLRLPLLGGLQSIAGALLVTALSAGVLPAQAAPQQPATAPTATVAATSDDQPQEARSSEHQGHSDKGGYLVRPGDDLWSIAEQVLGDGSRWRLIADANPELLANPTVDLAPGVRLAIPETGWPKAEPRTVTVRRGDTLSGLAEKHLGDSAKWTRIFQANRDRIEDPDQIDIGWKLVIPAGPADSSKPVQARPVRKPATVPQQQAPEIQQPAPEIQQPAPEPAPQQQQPAQQQPAEQQPVEAGTPASDPAWPLIGGLSGAAAAMILAGVGVNRLGQLRARPIGRRINHPPVDVRRYETALGHRERPESTELLEQALRTLGAHAHATGSPLPRLQLIRLDEASVRFEWSRPPAVGAPEGFDETDGCWRLTTAAASALPPSTHPVPFPALVTLGRDDQDAWIMVDLEARSPLALDGPRALRHAAAAAMAVELSCSPWASELSLTVVGGDEMFVRAACPELVSFHARAEPALDALEALLVERGADESAIALLRVDPDRAEAGAAQVLLVADELDDAEASRLARLLADRDLGVGGVVAGSGDAVLRLSGTESDPQASLEPDGLSLRPQLIAAHTRAAIGTIFAATDEATDTDAPWWSDADNVRPLVQRRESVQVGEPEPETVNHPYLKLIGPIELVGTAGPQPARARRQCEEYCAWLLQNPRSTATRMANELVVAETTRRSNMSRLRAWLGSDADGQPYLRQAYSGRIELHPAVESDWQRVQVLTASGLNRLAPDTLVRVLEFVRGAPLADAAPGQWRWAEELRTDIASLIRDAGVLLTRWALEHHDLDVARWAAARALLAAPEDELLLVERINTEALAGNAAEVQRLVRWVTGQARVLGVDLAPETVDACQRAMEGRTRPRAAR
ncbi:MAG: LysM peptidoglycan-binding domain-containing protein [Micropruina sp.]|uniref:LysM peptidoglycan-binding domain-containing protein n=1 Tax=Micropruina sp. TaxID=2737536 RepID=UPI0039E30F72